ncbi:hypothetical protein OG871_38620 [Kitasatospora sp. NBC_00374]|uniref:hypothetical protein n=1 Tax=Kitasatospora sp. NBC_00374 TaxID=2975964 RepID=UPI003244E19E
MKKITALGAEDSDVHTPAGWKPLPAGTRRDLLLGPARALDAGPGSGREQRRAAGTMGR